MNPNNILSVFSKLINKPHMDKKSKKNHTEKFENVNNNNNNDLNSNFECNICLDQAKDAVISLCGHLFCWPCLYQWFETKPFKTECPVCKDPISQDKVIPLYGRGPSNTTSSQQTSPSQPNSTSHQQSNSTNNRFKCPPRPTPKRSANKASSADNNTTFMNYFDSFLFYPSQNTTASGDGGGTFHLSFGIGAFPFGFISTLFNLSGGGVGGGGVPNARTVITDDSIPYYPDDQFLSQIFVWVALLFIAWLLLA